MSDDTADRVNHEDPLRCRWGEINYNAFGWSDAYCDRRATLARGTLLLCHGHVRAAADFAGFLSVEQAERNVRFRRKAKMDRLELDNSRMWQRIQKLEQQLVDGRKRKPVPTQGIIYFVRVGGLIKIGWTSNLERRMREYQPDSRLLATMPGTRKEEKALHRKYAHLKTHGREWFPLAPQIDELVAQVVADHGPPPVVDFSARSRTRAVGPKLKPTDKGEQHHGAWGQATG